MSTTARNDTARDPFEKAHALFGEMVGWLGSTAHDADHTGIETELRERGDELLRLAYQGHLDQRFARERAALRGAPPPGLEVRTRRRELETLFGRVRVQRVALSPRRARPRQARALAPKVRRPPRLRGALRNASMPADGRLSLPTQLYSAPMREQAVLSVVDVSYQSAREQIDRQTAGHIPHRQMAQLIQCVAQDFEAFYETRTPTASQPLSTAVLEVMSTDSKGVRMRPEGLREETRKLAQQETRSAVKGDPMAQRRARNHDRRMAVVTANWEQEPCVRTPQDIVRDLTAPKTGRPRPVARSDSPRKDLPRPQNKRVRAGLVQEQKARIHEMFAEAEHRDPTHQRPWVALVDGSESQLAQVRAKAEALGVALTIIVDVIHVLHYLWTLSGLLSAANDGARDLWVREHLMRLMTRPAIHVIAGIRQTATLRHLVGDDRKAVDDAVRYLENNAQYMDYGSYLAAGMPIATGVIEGACRYLVQDRMGITGACWGLDGAEAVLKLRSVHVSGDWKDFWAFHLRKEHERNYPEMKAA